MKAVKDWVWSWVYRDDAQEEGVKITSLNETEQAIIQCKLCRDNILVYIKKMDKVATAKREKAKSLLEAKEKDRARIYLRQSKFHSEQSKVSLKQLEMIEGQIALIETNDQLLEINNALLKGNAILKKLHHEINIEKWEKMEDDIAESKSYQDDISSFFKQYHIDEDKYNDSLNSDFDKLLQDLGLDNSSSNNNNNKRLDVNLPSAHHGEILINKNEGNNGEKDNEKVLFSA